MFSLFIFLSRLSRVPDGAQERFEDEPVGYPLLITLSMKLMYTKGQLRSLIVNLILPLAVDESLTEDSDMPFGVWAGFGFNKYARLLRNDNDLFDLNQRNLKFIVQWNRVENYKGVARYQWETRPLDASALDASTGKYRYLKEQ